MNKPNSSPQATADGPPTELCKHCGRTYGSHYYPGAYCASGGMCYDPMTTPQPTAESGQPMSDEDEIELWMDRMSSTFLTMSRSELVRAAWRAGKAAGK